MDGVQKRVEEMVEELQLYRKLGLFSRIEIKQIIKKRSDFEYKLNRSGPPQKSVYMNYIKYEINLSSLLALRMSKEPSLRLPGNFIQDRIFNIFERAVRQISDPSLYTTYTKYISLTHKRTERIPLVWQSAVRANPRNAELWIQYAEHWINDGAVLRAREVFQEGLRFNQDSKELWLTFFEFEIMHAKNLLTSATEEAEKSTEPMLVTPVMEFAVARVILENASKNFPNDLPFRLEFVTRTRRHGNHTAKFQDEIYENIQRDFPENSEAIYRIAKRDMTEDRPFQIMRSALEKNDTEDLRLKYVDLLQDYVSDLKKPKIVKSQFGTFLAEMNEKNLWTEKLFLKVISFIRFFHSQKISKEKNAPKKDSKNIYAEILTEISRKSVEKFPKNSELWLAYVETENDKQKALARALKSLPNSAEISLKYVTRFLKKDWNTFKLKFQEAMVRVALGPDLQSFQVNVCRLVTRRVKDSSQRKIFYQMCYDMPKVSLEFHRMVIDREIEAKELDIRYFFEKATSDYGKVDADIWIQYIQWERQHGSQTKANDITLRAKRTLENPTEFHVKLRTSQASENDDMEWGDALASMPKKSKASRK